MRYFYCYSTKMVDFFCKNGLRYIRSDIHKKTNKRFWVFESSDKITYLLNMWRLNKQNIK